MASKKVCEDTKRYVLAQLDEFDDKEVVDYECETYASLDKAKEALAGFDEENWVIAEVQFINKIIHKSEVVPYNA